MNNILSLEFEILASEIAAQAFPQFRFIISSHQSYNQKKVSLKLQGRRNYTTNTLIHNSSAFHQQSTIFFDLDFYPHSRCLSLETKFEDKKYSLFYHSIGYLFWSINNQKGSTPPSVFEKELEYIVKKLYPILEEFFLG